jgi:RNA polymerase sigma-70 factor (ECF subfamily)
MIQMLPDNYREAVILSEIKGLTQKEVARVQGTSLSGAKSRVQRGRAQLKEMLAECCRLEFDHSGRLYNYERKGKSCDAC